jgi:hypothetical protein
MGLFAGLEQQQGEILKKTRYLVSWHPPCAGLLAESRSGEQDKDRQHVAKCGDKR